MEKKKKIYFFFQKGVVIQNHFKPILSIRLTGNAHTVYYCIYNGKREKFVTYTLHLGTITSNDDIPRAFRYNLPSKRVFQQCGRKLCAVILILINAIILYTARRRHHRCR